MNRGIFIFLGAIAALGFAGLYVLQHGSSLFISRPQTELIAFVSTRGGQTDIWTMKTGGTDKRRVTNDAAEDTAPAWSPEGTEILSASNREDQRYEIFACAWNGKYVKRLSTGAGTKDLPNWSPDGKEIMFLASGAVHILPRFGGDDLQVLPTVEQGATQFSSPVLDAKWSPNRRTLAAVLDAGSLETALVFEDFDNPDRTPLPPLTAAGSIKIAWSKSDYRLAVAFIDRRSRDRKEAGMANGILVFDPGEMSFGQIQVSDDPGVGPGKLTWSPDGKHIAFEMWKITDGHPDKCLGLYIVMSRGGKPTLLAKGDALDPTWSPDSRYVAYTLSRKDGKRDIWRIGADGKGAVNLTGGEGDNFMPEWSPAPKKR